MKLPSALLVAVSLVAIPALCANDTAVGWDAVPAILARIQPPTFPARDFPITAHGAVADGTTDATAAIQAAIDACHASGGGRVVVPAGTWPTGALRLKSNVNLHVAEGATLRFSTDPAKYPTVFTRWEGVECMNYSSLIYAFEAENIALTGKGTLDGQSSNANWWNWKNTTGYDWARGIRGPEFLQTPDREKLFAMGEAGVPVAERVFGAGHHLRPSFVHPYRCANVLIEGVTLLGAPFWQVHPVLCTNVTVRGLTIVAHGPNTDGCNPESCRDVLIEDCFFDTGDDCIAIKSGRNNDARRIGVPSESIIVRRCRMKNGHGGVVLGSEISGGCRNVFVEDCVMDSPKLARALRFKSNAQRGAVIENIFMRRVEIGRVSNSIINIQLDYEEGANGPHRPVVRNVHIEQLTGKSSPRVLRITGFPGAVVENVVVKDCTFAGVELADMITQDADVRLENVRVVPVVVK